MKENSELMEIGECKSTRNKPMKPKQTDETETNEAFTKHMPGPTPPDVHWNSSTKWRMTCG